jgi:hypothetical protein
MKLSVALKILLGTASLALPLVASAESNFQTGAGALTATAHVDFQIVIPKILFLRVGTGSAYNTTAVLASNPAVDLITFSPTLAQVGNSVAVAGVGGDIIASPGAETAALVSNSGNVTLTATTTALTDANGDVIPNTQISTAATALSTATTLPVVPLANAGVSAPVLITAPPSKIINEDAKWTYTYLNTTTPPGGTYGGVNTQGGRVTYTATMP